MIQNNSSKQFFAAKALLKRRIESKKNSLVRKNIMNLINNSIKGLFAK